MNLQALNAPTPLERRRRESSFTQSLDDPLKYMEMVKKTLGHNEEERIPKEVRNRLENIDEENISVNFIRRQFSNFSLHKEPGQMPPIEENSPTKLC